MRLNFYCSKCGAELRITEAEEKAVNSDRLMLRQGDNSFYVAPCMSCVNTAEIDQKVDALYQAVMSFKAGL